METIGAVIGALLLFLLGLRLSAFFSGSETGFYRLSFLRLSIDANAGDEVARRLLHFARNPSHFVGTTLVGNNLANYLTTLAIGLFVVSLYPEQADWLEIAATVALSPLVFVFGELVPKNLYYRAPHALLRRDAKWIVFFYRLFFVISIPLIWLTKLIERVGGAEKPTLELVLGRNRLVQVLSYGQREGLLTDTQGRLVHGLLKTAPLPVTTAMTAAARVAGVPENASVDRVAQVALQTGLSLVPVRRADSATEWHGYVRLADLKVAKKPLAEAIRPMPRVVPSCSRLEALLSMRNAEAAFCAVVDNDRVVGVVSERRLIEELFRLPQAIGLATAETARSETS